MNLTKSRPAKSFILAMVVTALMTTLACASESASVTCADREMSVACGDPTTIVGFVALMCGPDNIKTDASASSIFRFGEPPDGEPRILVFSIWCGETEFTWKREEGRQYEYVDDWPTVNKQTEDAVKLFSLYSNAIIDRDEARRRLLALR